MRHPLALLLSMSLLGCASAQDQNPPPIPEGSYPLTQGSAAHIGPDASVSLDTVNDSRCPPKVMCMQKGALNYVFTLNVKGQAEHFTLTPEQPSYTPATLPGVSLTMDPGATPPAARTKEPTPPHNVTLQVSRKSP